jgi:glycerol-3-phosphate dehydrogenase
VNYTRVTDLLRGAENSIQGVVIRDEESGREEKVAARMVINATGVFCDSVRQMRDANEPPIVTASQGIHLVFAGSMLGSNTALMIPSTPDGRVVFAIPWHGHTLVGTTDVAIGDMPLEPRPSDAEIDYLLETVAGYFEQPPTRADVLSSFAGIRPLLRPTRRVATAALARDHAIRIDAPGLITITGGKWTTYRAMAEDCVNQAARAAGLSPQPCVTQSLPIHAPDTANIAQLVAREGLGEPLHPNLPYTAGDVVWAARYEMARTVEDVLARRTRALFLNARAAIAMAPRTAELLARELGRDDAWRADQVRTFEATAQKYTVQ